MVRAGVMACFHSSCISACIISKELCGRWIEIWPWLSAAVRVKVCLVVVVMLGVLGGESGGTIRLTRNSRSTPRERLPMTQRGPR